MKKAYISGKGRAGLRGQKRPKGGGIGGGIGGV
jgi:hypothetical protein